MNYKKLFMLFLPLIAISTQHLNAMWEDSKVFLINHTPFPLTISTTVTGGLERDKWKQAVNTLMPGQKAQMLQFSRNKGIKNNQEYLINTTITIPKFNQLGQNNPAIEITLKQKLEGNLIGSDLWQSASGPGFSHNWFQDRNVHKQKFKRGNEIFILSYKAIATASTDNIEYAINWAPQYKDPKPSSPNEINIGFQNVWMRPTASAIGCVGKRIDPLANLIGRNYDVLVFAELFDSKASLLLEKFKKMGYIYQTKIVGAGTSLLEGVVNGGVAIISKYPFLTLDNNLPYKEIIFKNSCASDDCLGAKGVIYAKILKDGKKYNIFATHTNASYSLPPELDTVTARVKQFYDIKTFINQQNIPASEPVIIAGDMNVDMVNPNSEYYVFTYQGLFKYKETKTRRSVNEYENMLKAMHAVHPPLKGYQGVNEIKKDNKFYSLNPTINTLATEAVVSMSDVEFLDYIFYSKDHLQPIESFNEMRMINITDPYTCTSTGISDLGKKLEYVTAVSDHWFIYGYFKFPE